RARTYLEQARGLYDPPQHHALISISAGFDSGLMASFWLAVALWMLGYPEQALQKNTEALAFAHELSHPSSLAYTLGFAAPWLHQLRRDVQATKERTEAAIRYSTEKGFQLWAAWGTMLQGWELTEQGQLEEGIAQIRQGLAVHRATGAEATRPQYL